MSKRSSAARQCSLGKGAAPLGMSSALRPCSPSPCPHEGHLVMQLLPCSKPQTAQSQSCTAVSMLVFQVEKNHVRLCRATPQIMGSNRAAEALILLGRSELWGQRALSFWAGLRILLSPLGCWQCCPPLCRWVCGTGWTHSHPTLPAWHWHIQHPFSQNTNSYKNRVNDWPGLNTARISGHATHHQTSLKYKRGCRKQHLGIHTQSHGVVSQERGQRKTDNRGQR